MFHANDILLFPDCCVDITKREGRIYEFYSQNGHMNMNTIKMLDLQEYLKSFIKPRYQYLVENPCVKFD